MRRDVQFRLGAILRAAVLAGSVVFLPLAGSVVPLPLSPFLPLPPFLALPSALFLPLWCLFFLPAAFLGEPDSEAWGGFWSVVEATLIPFAAPLRTGLFWLGWDGDEAASAAPVPCDTTTQLPNPEVVVKDARQRSLFLPPVH